MENTLVLFDYTEVVTDPWWGDYETFCCIGQGNLSANSVLQQLSVMQGPLTVRINSVGGSVFDGFAIYNALIKYKSQGKVTVRIEGLAASIASIIAMAGDEVIICQAAMIMVHKPTIDPFWCGAMDATDLQREADALTQIEAVLNDIYASKTGLGATKIQNMIDAETWLTPDMAKMLGFADMIEKTVTAPEMVQPAYNHLFKNANAQTKLYINNAFKITNMSTPNEALLKAVKDNAEKTTTLMGWFQNKFGKGKSAAQNACATLANGNPIYYNDADDFAEGTAVFADADMQEPFDDGAYVLNDQTQITVAEGVLESVAEQEVITTDSAEVIALRAENEQLRTALNTANASLGAVNSTIEKLKNVKSAYVPPSAKQEFNNSGKEIVENDAKSAIERHKARQAKAAGKQPA